MKNPKRIIILIGIVLLSLVASFSFISKQFNYSPKLLINTLSQAYKQTNNLPKNINFIILGVDQRDDWLEKSQDTDSVIFANLNTDNLNLTLIPLPRDLWFQPTLSRINKIYQSSLEQDNPSDYIKQSFQAIVGAPIDHLVVIDTQVLVPLINAVGPIEVNLEYGFTDDQYPDPNHIADPQDNPSPYMTISFEQGQNIINSQNVLYFVRSRKGAQTAQLGGTDVGRSQRQQLLLEAILKKLKKTNPTNLGMFAGLYQIWSQQIQKDIDDQTLISIVIKNKLNINKLDVNSIDLPVQDRNTGKTGVIYHPTYFSNDAWVYLPTESDYSSIHHFVDQQMN